MVSVRRHRLFSRSPIERAVTLPVTHSLDQKAAHYLSHVVRSKPGDEIVVFDGGGGEFHGVIETLGRQHTQVKLTRFLESDLASPLNVELGLGVSRGDRMDYALQKATELGVRKIVPLTTQYSDRKLKPAALQKKQLHWHGVLASACEQCGLNQLPELTEPNTPMQWASAECSRTRLLLHPGGQTLSVAQLQVMHNEAGFKLAIGPEGGFSDDEAVLLAEQGFRNTALGPRVLRTETAPVAMLAILQFIGGDLSGD